MDGTFTQWDLVTYPGLMAAVVAVIGALKSLFPKWIDGKEPVLGLSFSYVLGIAARLTIPGAFSKVNWVVFLISLLVVAAGAKWGHDHLLNQVIKGKSDDDVPPADPAPATDASPAAADGSKK